MFQRGESLRVESMLVGPGWGVGLRPDGGEILVGRRAPGRVESHAELWQAEGRAVVDQLPGTGNGRDQVVEEARLGDAEPAPRLLPRQSRSQWLRCVVASQHVAQLPGKRFQK